MEPNETLASELLEKADRDQLLRLAKTFIRVEEIIDSVYDWADVQEAHRRMEANENLGKIVLRVA